MFYVCYRVLYQRIKVDDDGDQIQIKIKFIKQQRAWSLLQVAKNLLCQMVKYL